jgi:hypothetical protein
MLVGQQWPPPKVLSQSPPQSSSYREKERARARSRRPSPNLAIAIPISFTPPTSQQSHMVVSCPQPSAKDHRREADHEEFSQKLRNSSSPRRQHNNSHCKSPKLFDPHHDLIPTRRSGGTEDPFDGGEKEREREPTNVFRSFRARLAGERNGGLREQRLLDTVEEALSGVVKLGDEDQAGGELC